MTIFDMSPCANCGHASAIHQVGSVCGAAHCKCRAFVVDYACDEPTEAQLTRSGAYVPDGRDENARSL